jgi:hypothetical protein
MTLLSAEVRMLRAVNKALSKASEDGILYLYAVLATNLGLSILQ